MRRFIVAVVAAGLLAAAANASAPYYVRGIFGTWDPPTYQMNDDGDGSYSLTIDTSGQTAGSLFQFKCANADWSQVAPPGNNVQLRYVAGEMTFHFYPNFTDDGWMPPTAWGANRVGYNDTTGWELIWMTSSNAASLMWATSTSMPRRFISRTMSSPSRVRP